MAPRTVRLDPEAEQVLASLTRSSGLSISEVLKRGLMAYQQQTQDAPAPIAPYELFRRLDLGPGGYARAPAKDAKPARGPRSFAATAHDSAAQEAERRDLRADARISMALTDIETARVKKVVGDFIARRRPPPHLRPKLDLGFRVSGQSVEVFEIRPVWRGPPGAKHEGAVAKATYVRARNRWRVFWQRRDLKWHGYDPMPEVASIDEFVALVDEDRHAAFFG